jgi:uncharacterized protein YkwD
MRAAWILVLGGISAAGPAGESRFAAEFLEAHNAVRADVDLPPLRWSEKLAEVAREWATSEIVRFQFQHSHLGHGENLFEIRGGRVTPADVVDAWASEVHDYDAPANRCRRGKCGHYTQIVWRATTAVGCGAAHSSFREVWVCEYDPPGNVVGQRPY